MFFEQKSSQNQHLFTEIDQISRKSSITKNIAKGLIVILIMAIISLPLYFLAITGLVKLPLIGRYIYTDDPMPSQAIINNQVLKWGDIVNARISELDSDQIEQLSDKGLSLSLTKEQLTALIQNPAVDGNLPFKQAQIAWDLDQWEWYTKLIVHSKLRPLTIRLQLNLPLNAQESSIKQLFLGQLKINNPLAEKILRRWIIKQESFSDIEILEHIINLNVIGRRWQLETAQIDGDKIILHISPDSLNETIQN